MTYQVNPIKFAFKAFKFSNSNVSNFSPVFNMSVRVFSPFVLLCSAIRMCG